MTKAVIKWYGVETRGRTSPHKPLSSTPRGPRPHVPSSHVSCENGHRKRIFACSVRDANSIVSSYSCGRAKYIRICYVRRVICSKTEEKILRFQEYPVTCRQGLKWPSRCLSPSLKTLDVRWRRKKLLHVQSNCFAYLLFICSFPSLTCW